MKEKNTFRLRFVAEYCVAVFFLCAIQFQGAAAQDFTRYHTYADLTSLLKQITASGGDIARMTSIGVTLENREIWLIEIANPKGIPIGQRQGMLIGANFEGDHLIGSEISCYIADYLVKKYKTDAGIREAIDNHVFYIIPRVNPDGAERMFAPLKTGSRTNTHALDDDNDGRLDEDGPEDLNGDVNYTVMRVNDPEGVYMIDPDEPRLMKKADPVKGETGAYKIFL
ncbi:MAG: M14 family zinc carboxypeptidase, partial [Candidatus Latescibacterota bacterium]